MSSDLNILRNSPKSDPSNHHCPTQLEDSITDCLCLLQKMYSAGSIDNQKRDALKELVFDEDPELFSYFNQPGSDLKTIESRILNHFSHTEKSGLLMLFNNENNNEFGTAKCTSFPNNYKTIDLQNPPASLFNLKPEKLISE